MQEPKSYALYKGLQRPLVFKFFKGRFIYWALGAIVSGIVIGGLLSVFVSSLVGIAGMALVTTPLLFHTISKQKKGLHRKSSEKNIWMIPPKQKIYDEAKKNI